MFYRFSIAPTAILSHLANLNLQKECYTNGLQQSLMNNDHPLYFTPEVFITADP
jgi:hypothetical protein